MWCNYGTHACNMYACIIVLILDTLHHMHATCIHAHLYKYLGLPLSHWSLRWTTCLSSIYSMYLEHYLVTMALFSNSCLHLLPYFLMNNGKLFSIYQSCFRLTSKGTCLLRHDFKRIHNVKNMYWRKEWIREGWKKKRIKWIGSSQAPVSDLPSISHTVGS